MNQCFLCPFLARLVDVIADFEVGSDSGSSKDPPQISCLRTGAFEGWTQIDAGAVFAADIVSPFIYSRFQDQYQSRAS
jgi:hypothetical protein